MFSAILTTIAIAVADYRRQGNVKPFTFREKDPVIQGVCDFYIEDHFIISVSAKLSPEALKGILKEIEGVVDALWEATNAK